MTGLPSSASKRRRIGAHTSIAGSLANAAAEAAGLGCNTFQIFSRSPRMWRAPPLAPDQIAELGELRRKHDLRPLAIHGSYLLNLAAHEEPTRAKSVAGFRGEIERALAIGADYLVFHPGSAKGYGSADEAIENLAAAFAEAAAGLSWDGLTILLENTAGGGSSLGRTFEELAAIRKALAARCGAPVGYCLDTAHLFAAGYDVSTAKGLGGTIETADALLRLPRVALIHFNDSKTKLGSLADRHASIGEGLIGREAMRRIVNHPALREKPFILETPHGKDGTHRGNVETLKALIAR